MTAVVLEDVYCVHRTAEGDAAALSGISLSVQERALLCVIGPSGAGKSTLLRVIAGLQSPSAGVVQVYGVEIGRASAAARASVRQAQIGFLDQRAEAALAPELPIGDAVGLPLALRGHSRAQQRARASELLTMVGLGDRARALPSELSGGERQRVALCVALAHRPRLLLADEPTGELDAASSRSLGDRIRELVRAHGATAVMVSHDPDLAKIADRAVEIREGRVVRERDQREAAELVVGAGGWVRIPSDMLGRAGIEERARIREALGALILESPTDPTPQCSKPAGAAEARAKAASDHQPALIELRAVSRDKGSGGAKRRVIDGLNWSFASGQLTVVSGRSGSGKTTLLRLIAGLERPDAGSVVLDRVELSELDPERLAALRRARIGYVAQEPWPVAFMSVEENVMLALRVRGWSSHDAAARTRVVLEQVGLCTRVRQRVGRLSAGEAQRVALARALAGAAGVLIADEPTSRLDEHSGAEVAELLAHAAHDHAQTVICATHDANLIQQADALLALGCGAVRRVGLAAGCPSRSI